MKKIFVLIISLTIGCLGFAQKNVVKLSPFGLTYGRYNLQYERFLTDYSSASISCSYIKPNIPSLATVEDVLSGFGIEGDMDGFAIELDYRLYSQNKPGPQGFYIGPYMRYTGLGAMAKYDPDYVSDLDKIEVGFSGFRTGAGVKLGAQWLLFNCVTIDWNFFGIGFDYYGLKLYSMGTETNNGVNTSTQEVEKTGGFIPGFNTDFSISYAF